MILVVDEQCAPTPIGAQGVLIPAYIVRWLKANDARGPEPGEPTWSRFLRHVSNVDQCSVCGAGPEEPCDAGLHA